MKYEKLNSGEILLSENLSDGKNRLFYKGDSYEEAEKGLRVWINRCEESLKKGSLNGKWC